MRNSFHIMAVFVFLLVGLSAPVNAQLYADFWAVDNDATPGVTLEFNLLSLDPAATFWFSTDQANWIGIPDTNTLKLQTTTHLFFKADPSYSDPLLTFNATDENSLSNSLFVLWYDPMPSFSLVTPKGGDKLAAMIPIPPAALLLVTGLLGFVAFRRKVKHI